MITFRRMSVEDIPAGLSLCRAAGWNQVANDWELFLKLSPDGCKVAVDETGQILGTVTTVNYQKHFSWIGMVLVDPARRRQGIGTKLLQQALSILQGEETVKLDATPAGREVYLKVGFNDEYSLNRLQLTSFTRKDLPKSNATPMHHDDLDAVMQIDKKVFGADRSLILKNLFKNTPQFAFVKRANGEAISYCFGRPGHNFTHIGPIVSINQDEAKELVIAAVKNCEGDSIILDVPNQNTEWHSFLISLGFELQRPFIRMYLGKNNYPGVIENQYAILGPEFG